MRVEHHQIVPRDEGWQVGEVIHGVETESEPSRRRRPVNLAILPYPRDVVKVRGGKHRVVPRHQRGALPPRHLRTQEALIAAAGLVEEEADLGGAGVIRVLYQLRNDSWAVGVRVEDVLEPRGERLVLPERLRAAVQLHVDVLGRLREEREAKRSNAHRLGGLRREFGVRQADALGRGEPRRVVESNLRRRDERARRVGYR